MGGNYGHDPTTGGLQMKLFRIVRRRPGMAVATASTLVLMAGAGVAVWYGNPITTLIVCLVGVMFIHDLYEGLVSWVAAWQYEGMRDDYVKAARTGRPVVLDTHEVWPVPHDQEEPDTWMP